MNFKFDAVFFDQIAQDLINAKKWYFKQSPQTNLDQKFSKEVETVIESICANPYIHQKRYFNLQAAKTKTFPFKIYFYLDEENRTIIIVGIIHNKMDSAAILKERL